MTTRSRFAFGAALAVSVLSLAGVGGPAAAASSTAGACSTDEGVTVVVDFHALGGDIVERCVPGPLGSHYTGWDALTDAGFQPQAPVRFPGFACRLSGKPSASKSLSIPGNSDYHEQCVNTPPDTAFWSYWYAKNGGSWTYSSTGAATRVVIDGGYEGWTFSLDHAGNPPKPGIAPDHPVAAPTSATSPTRPTRSTASSSGPSTGSPGGHHQGSGTETSTTAPTTATGPRSHHPRNKRPRSTTGRSTAEAPTTPAATGTAPTVAVTGEVPDADDSPSGGSAVPTLAGIGVVMLLGAGAGVTAWRRHTRRG